jgi:hypothetical protein
MLLARRSAQPVLQFFGPLVVDCGLGLVLLERMDVYQHGWTNDCVYGLGFAPAMTLKDPWYIKVHGVYRYFIRGE